jgi:CRISPR-associated protein Cas2
VKQFIVVCYDISDDHRRNGVMKVLRNFGTHVQYSVFECYLSKTQIQLLKKQLKQKLGPCDSVRIYYLCKLDIGQIEIFGNGERTPDHLFYLH